MTVVVAGAGAIGQWLGARLQSAGHDVVLWTTPRHVAPLREARIEGHTTFAGRLNAVTTPPAEAEAVIVTCKAHQTQHLAPLLPKAPVILSLQNGLGNVQKLSAHVPPESIAWGLTSHGVTLVAPGHLRHAGLGITTIGPGPDGAGDAAIAAEQLLLEARLNPEWQEDMRGHAWRKALVNHALNPVAALHGATNGEVLDHPVWLGLSLTLLTEGLRLAERARVNVPGDARQALLTTLENTRPNRVSMLQDVEAKRATEIECISGRFVRLAERLLVSMPRSEAVYGRLKELEATYLGADGAARTMWDELRWEQTPF